MHRRKVQIFAGFDYILLNWLTKVADHDKILFDNADFFFGYGDSTRAK